MLHESAGWSRWPREVGEVLPFPNPGCRGPFKANQDRRHRIPKRRHRVTNRAAYDAAPCARGSLAVWFSEEAIAA